MKTKNAPKDLKCKINHTFFLETGVPKRGGSDTWEKFPKNPVFWGGGRPLLCYVAGTSMILKIKMSEKPNVFYEWQTLL